MVPGRHANAEGGVSGAQHRADHSGGDCRRRPARVVARDAEAAAQVAVAMPRPTPHLDRACELLGQLERELALPSSVRDAGDPDVRLTVATAMVAANLAVAEALHGVIYVANANAV